MYSRILTYITFGATGVGAVLMGISAGLFPNAWNTNLYLCIAAVGIVALCLRFNIFALKNDRTDHMIPENHFFILISLYMILRFIDLCIGGMTPVLYFCLLGVLAIYLIFVIALYVKTKVLGR